MNIKILQDYIKRCTHMKITPTWQGLKNFKWFYF